MIPFVCPICAGANGAHLLTLSRSGGMDCAVCGKWLRSNDVARAMHAPRAERTAASAPIRAPVASDLPPRAAGWEALRGTGARGAPSRRDGITWPPTAESRARASRDRAVVLSR